MPPRTRTTPAPLPEPSPLPADLVEGLRRLKLGTIRRQGAEVLATAKIQRWTPEEVLRTLINAEITSRDASNQATRLKNAAFPVVKPWTSSRSTHHQYHRQRLTIWLRCNGSRPRTTFA